jgi:hypothetical protein
MSLADMVARAFSEAGIAARHYANVFGCNGPGADVKRSGRLRRCQSHAPVAPPPRGQKRQDSVMYAELLCCAGRFYPTHGPRHWLNIQLQMRPDRVRRFVTAGPAAPPLCDHYRSATWVAAVHASRRHIIYIVAIALHESSPFT